MASCPHSDLLEVYQHCIADTDRLKRLAHGMLGDPTTHGRLTRSSSAGHGQYCPSTVLCIGSVAKSSALARIFPRYNTTTRQTAVAHVHVELPQSGRKYPLYCIDADLQASLYSKSDMPYCHEIRSTRLQWQARDSNHFRILLFSRLITSITDVVCIFADDCGGLFGVEDILVQWASCGSDSVLPTAIKPRVLIVSSAGMMPHSLQLQHDIVARLSESVQFRKSFAGVRLVSSTDNLLSHIEEELLLSRLARSTTKLLFSAHNLAWVFRCAVKHFCKSTDVPFSPYTAFTTPNTAYDFGTHLTTALGLLQSIQPSVAIDKVHTYIASALLVAMYPPGGHLFAPAALFDSVFKSTIDAVSAVSCVSTTAVRSSIIEMISTRGLVTSAQEMHSATLLALAGHIPWAKVHTNNTCLTCLRRPPQHCLPCKHAFCDDCIVAWATPRRAQEYTYDLARCPLCLIPGAQSSTIMLKPPTAGIRIMSIDGGGIRGIVPLFFLQIVEERLASTLQHFFDIGFGSSSGGLSTLGLFGMNWSIADCISKFENLAHQIFNRRSTLGFLSHIKNGVSVVMNDALYDVEPYEKILQLQFGKFTQLFAAAVGGCSRYKFAVTASSIENSSPFLLSNYNTAAQIEDRSGYEHIRPDHIADEPKMWEAARATTAACSLFPVMALPIGTFQDGGSREHNDPTLITTWEARRIWPADTVFDVVLSLGTGSAIADPQEPLAKRHRWKDSFLPRFIRSSLSGIDGEVQSRHATNTVNTFNKDMKARYFRLNIESSARLDDAAALPDLCRSVEASKTVHDAQIADLCRALVASCFFFELDRLPERNSAGLLVSTGHIRVRGDQAATLQALRRISDHSQQALPRYTFLQGRQVLGDFDAITDICSRCGLFRKRVGFVLRNREEQFTISLRANGQERRISGFPQTLSWIIDQQGLDSFQQSPRRVGHKLCLCLSPARKTSKRPLDLVHVTPKKQGPLTIIRLEAEVETKAQSWL